MTITQDILDDIERVVATVPRPKPGSFSYFDWDDIKQESRLFACEALPRWDRKRSLFAFLFTHVHNRLNSLYRDKVSRSDPPCPHCHSGNPCEIAVAAGEAMCPKYRLWFERNSLKANLSCPEALENEPRKETDAYDQVAVRELERLIDIHLPVEFRQTYLQMRDGVKIPRSERERVEEVIRGILWPS